MVNKDDIPKIQLKTDPHPENILTWDYKGYKAPEKSISYQKDWNMTLITAVNQLSAKIRSKTYRGGANVIIAHTRFKPLFENNPYYKSSVISRYNLTFDNDAPEDSIRLMRIMGEHDLIRGVYGEGPKEGEEYEFFMIPTIEGDNISLTLRSFDNGDYDEISEYVPKTIGIINIKNYTDSDVAVETDERLQFNSKVETTTRHELINLINTTYNK